MLLWGLHQMGHRFAIFSTYALVGSLKWIMRALNSQGSRPWQLHHPSLQCRLPNQPHAPLPPPHQPMPHTLCLVPLLPIEHVQQFKVCYSGTQKFFTVSLDP